MTAAPTVFLDRDGVINRDRWPTPLSVAAVEFLPDALTAAATLSQNGFRLFIVTNKTAIGWRVLSRERNDEINAYILGKLEAAGARIEKLYYCGHHPLSGCDCRKPNPGMLVRAKDEFGVAPESSWMVGDNVSDVVAGKRFGARTILVTGTDARRRRLARAIEATGPDHVALSLAGALPILLSSRG